MIASFVAREATLRRDVSDEVKGHHGWRIEQHVHNFLEMVPLIAAVKHIVAFA
jgi:hypothetical protein